MTEISLILTNKTGLHARPAVTLVKTAAMYASRIILKGNGRTADAKSIVKVLSMGVKQGDELTVTADGPDEKESVRALRDLVENRFYED